MDKKTRIILGTTGLLLFLIIFIIGVTYAWFSVNVTGNEVAKGMNVQTGHLSINYSEGYNIQGQNILPSWSEAKNFTVKNTGERVAYYKLVWANLTNEFINKEDLVYSIAGTTDGTKLPGNLLEVSLPDSGEDIIIFDNIEIEPGKTHSYTLIMNYKNNGNQSSDMGKGLEGRLGVRSSEKMLPKYLVDVANVGQFVDYTPPAGKSSLSTTCFQNYANQYSGWRIFSKTGSGSNGFVTLIHGGTPECYYHANNNSLSVDNLNNIASSYINNNLASYARNINCDDVKTFDGSACTKSYPTITNDIILTGSLYYLSSFTGESLWTVGDFGCVHVNGNYSLGVRPIIILKAGIKKIGGLGTNESAFTIAT